MIKLTIDQQKKLLEMLLDDENFSTIRKELNVGERYNLKSLCEYEGGKIEKAYKLHRNNYKEKKNKDNSLATTNFLTEEAFLQGMSILSTQINKINVANNNETKIEYKKDVDDTIVLNTLPKVLPNRLQGENYVIKQTSIKVVENVYNEFINYCKNKKSGYSTIELYSLALLEFIEKYRI